MIDTIVIHNSHEATIYYTDGRMPFNVYTSGTNILDAVRELIYTTKDTTCITSKAA